MVGKRKRSQYRKSRKRLGFVGIQKQAWEKSQRTTNDEDGNHSEGSDLGNSPCDEGATASQTEETSTPNSASRRKLSQHSSLNPPDNTVEEDIIDETNSYRLVDIQQLSSAILDVYKCEEGNLVLEEERKQGFMSSFNMECGSCHNAEVLNTSSIVSQRGISYDVNRRMVYSSIEIGCGYEGLATLSTILNMPCMTKSAYHTHIILGNIPAKVQHPRIENV